MLLKCFLYRVLQNCFRQLIGLKEKFGICLVFILKAIRIYVEFYQIMDLRGTLYVKIFL